ncbi:MAG: sugar phosphate isomerase/epimerase [Oscillospiraceae bacterium]|nr:sugar phosphate isomerase/epimerase [Oscillospiraceae bacterium]
MINISNRLYISTTADDAASIAREHGFGLEIAEFCTAANMDHGLFEEYNKRALANMKGVSSFVLHAPFNEISPAAIDPLILKVAEKRYSQAAGIMRGYGINKMVAHSGFLPQVYYEQWFVPKSVEFWQKFLSDKSESFELCIENVLESSPDMLCKIAKEVNDGRLKLCFDAAHAAIMSPELSAMQWAERMLPYLGHVHLHNNFGEIDTHNALGNGIVDIAKLIEFIAGEKADVTFSIEAIDAKTSVNWLYARGFV